MITSHVLIKNEENFIWYSIMSVYSFVERILVWDTGSTDKTIDILEEIIKRDKEKKIAFKKLNLEYFDEGKIRQDMLNETSDGWFIVLDGDEIWWQDSIGEVTKFIRNHGENKESIVVPTINLVGDIFHYQEKEAGKYSLAGKKGHYAIRAINKKILGLHSRGEHGIWGWVDGEERMIQNRDAKKIKFLNAPYLHATHLQRTGNVFDNKDVLKRSFKLKHELGIEFSKDFYYPEVFFQPRPINVPNVWKNMSLKFKFRAFFETPLRQINRRYLPEKVGY